MWTSLVLSHRSLQSSCLTHLHSFVSATNTHNHFLPRTSSGHTRLGIRWMIFFLLPVLHHDLTSVMYSSVAACLQVPLLLPQLHSLKTLPLGTNQGFLQPFNLCLSKQTYTSHLRSTGPTSSFPQPLLAFTPRPLLFLSVTCHL